MKRPKPLIRVIADLIDGVILIAIKLLFAGAFIPVSLSVKNLENIGATLNMILWSFYFIVITLIFFLYYIYFFTVYGASPGKMLFGLKVVDYKTGRNITMRQSFLRAIGYLISGLPAYLGMIWILFNNEKRGWHDMIAGTIMTYSRKK